MPNNIKNTRRCIVCRNHSDKSLLTRIVKKEDGTVIIDNDKKYAGRGVYVHNTPECKNLLKKKKMLSSALKTSVPDEFYEEL